MVVTRRQAVRQQTRTISANVREVAAGLRPSVPAPASPYGQPAIAMLMGFPGAGKSHAARLLAARLGAAHVASDHLRTELFVAPTYTPEENAAVFRVLDALVVALLSDGHRVIVDATNLRREHRSSLERIAQGGAVPLTHVLVTADEAEILARLAARRARRSAGDRSEADEKVYAAMRDIGFEEPPVPYLVLRSGREVQSEAERVASELEERWSAGATPSGTPGGGR